MQTRRHGSVLTFLMFLALVAQGCSRGKVYASAPAAGDGIRVEAKSVRLKGNVVEAELMAYNNTDAVIEINRNQIAIVGPDGSEAYRRGAREIHILPARGKHPINLDAQVNAAAYKKAPGFFLRFDGFYVGDVRVALSPMVVGQPLHSPGGTNPTFVASAQQQTQRGNVAAATGNNKPGMFRRMVNAVKGDDTTQTASLNTAPQEQGMQQYRGPRRTLKNRGVKCAAMPLKTREVADQMAFIMDELLLTELQQSGFEAIGPDDINAMIGFEKTKEAVGCDEMACVAEIGSALGVDYLAAGNVAGLDGSMVLTLKLIDVRNTKVLSRVNKVSEGGDKGLPRMIAEAVQELVERSEL